MLFIREDVLNEVSECFLKHDVEQGFLLGSTRRLNQVNRCCRLFTEQADVYFITPNAEKATEQIREWAEQKVCFCGMVHSHVCPKRELSKADIEFAEALMQVYELLVLWFGIGIVERGTVTFRFYKVVKRQNKAEIAAANYQIERTMETDDCTPLER